MIRDLYIAEYERLYSERFDELLAGGYTRRRAHTLADDWAALRAYDAMREKLADYADYSRKKS